MLCFDLPPVSVRGPSALHPALGALRFMRDPIPAALDWRARYGAVAAATDRSATTVVALTPETFRELVTGDAWERPRGGLVSAPTERPELDELFGSFLLLNGPEHRWRRRVALQPTHARDSLAWMAGVMGEEAEASAALLPGHDDVVDVWAAARRVALRNNARCLMGVTDADDVAEFASRAAFVTDAMLSPAVGATQWLARRFRGGVPLPGTPYARWVDAVAALRSHLHALARERRAQPGRDLLSVLARCRDEETGRALTDADLAAEVLGLYGAGYDTTAVTIAWTMLLLAAHPAAGAAVAAEARDVLRGHAPTPADMARLPALDAAVREAMRLLPAAVLTIPRVATARTSLGGHELPAGTMAFGSPLAIHHDPRVWDAPHAFRPSRWRDAKPDTYAYVPFGAGPRRCIGAQVAELQTRIVVATWVQARAWTVPAAARRVDCAMRQIVFAPRGPLTLGLSRGPWRGGDPAVALTGPLARLVHAPA